MLQTNATIMTFRLISLAALAASLALPMHAQTAAPSAAEMIEKLTPAPLTRSLRNLTVEPVAPPSLSLLIQFDFDSARVRPESREALVNLSQAMKSGTLANARFGIEATPTPGADLTTT